jgi:hypothetical protein
LLLFVWCAPTDMAAARANRLGGFLGFGTSMVAALGAMGAATGDATRAEARTAGPVAVALGGAVVPGLLPLPPEISRRMAPMLLLVSELFSLCGEARELGAVCLSAWGGCGGGVLCMVCWW